MDWEGLGGPEPTSGVEGERKGESLCKVSTKGLNAQLKF